MLRKLPIISPPFTCRNLLCALKDTNQQGVAGEFRRFLSEFTQSKYVYLTNSGISAFYLTLEALKEKSGRKEVILPAYTAGSLVVAVWKAGLMPVLCDISLEDFNLERNILLKTISAKTLAVVAVHMFGIAMQDIAELRKNMPAEVFLIEDCAQAMGSTVCGRQVGSFADVSFFSFNRGKNLALCRGGCIVTNRADLAQIIGKKIEKLKSENLWRDFLLPMEAIFFSLAVNPRVYGLGFPLLNFFKDTRPPKDFPVKKMPIFSAALGLGLQKEMDRLFAQRQGNAMQLINALKGIPGVILPKISQETRPVFNRLPVAFQDLKQKESIAAKLWKNGIETSRMYLKPLHRMFNLGYNKDDFPNAVYFAEHLLTLPVHPAVEEKDLLKIIAIIRRTLEKC